MQGGVALEVLCGGEEKFASRRQELKFKAHKKDRVKNQIERLDRNCLNLYLKDENEGPLSTKSVINLIIPIFLLLPIHLKKAYLNHFITFPRRGMM